MRQRWYISNPNTSSPIIPVGTSNTKITVYWSLAPPANITMKHNTPEIMDIIWATIEKRNDTKYLNDIK